MMLQKCWSPVLAGVLGMSLAAGLHAAEPASALDKPAALAGKDLELTWNDHFATHEESPAAVREAVRKLFDKHQFDHVIAVINAALRHGQGQPWMHEVLGLAMQANGRPQAEIERALLSAIDLQEPNIVNLMYAAKYLAANGSPARALKLFRQASASVPTRPEPLLHGLDLAQQLGDIEGIKWATTGILGQAWPEKQSDLWEQAHGLAVETLKQLRAAKRFKEATEFEQALTAALERDVMVVVSWPGEADVDLVVEEPSGTVCSHRHDRSTGGGVLLGDSFARQGQRSNKVVSETYICPQAFDGKYRLKLRRVWGKLPANQVTVDIYTHWNSPRAEHVHRQIPLGDDDAAVVFSLDAGRRQEHLADHLVANAADQQAEVRRDLLMQQLGGLSGASGISDLITSRQRAFASGVLPFGMNQAVGYQPVIIVLSEGASLSAQAVISADRRYVRFTGVPLFTGIGDVTTYNIQSGASTRGGQSGGAQGGAGLGGGGDPFGGGGGGGGGAAF